MLYLVRKKNIDFLDTLASYPVASLPLKLVKKRWLVWGEKLSSTDGFWTNQLQCGLQACHLTFLVTISIKQTQKNLQNLTHK